MDDDRHNPYRQWATQALVHIARDLRQRQTSPETLLWACLRDRRLAGIKFRRQHPVAKTAYVVDFFSYDHQLVIELDGGIHSTQIAADDQRQRELEALGLRVLRFPNDQLYADLETVLTLIAQTALASPVSNESLALGEGLESDDDRGRECQGTPPSHDDRPGT
ncbi:MAG: DUF559 domain-containing protein [Anaerolineae bacterium]|nr:DUF559 domain-containing protein [Anaerolineae bacterium]